MQLTTEQRDELGKANRDAWLKYSEENSEFEDSIEPLTWEHLNEVDREAHRIAAAEIYERGYYEGYNDAYDRK